MHTVDIPVVDHLPVIAEIIIELGDLDRAQILIKNLPITGPRWAAWLLSASPDMQGIALLLKVKPLVAIKNDAVYMQGRPLRGQIAAKRIGGRGDSRRRLCPTGRGRRNAQKKKQFSHGGKLTPDHRITFFFFDLFCT